MYTNNIHLIKQSQLGDEDATNTLYKEYNNFIKANSLGYYLPNAEPDDVLQEGMIGFSKAITAYDFEQASFTTFASLCIKRQIFSAMKKEYSNKNKAFRMTNFTFSNEESSSGISKELAFKYPNPEEEYLLKEQVTFLKKNLKKELSSFELEVYRKLALGFTYIEIADLLEKNSKAIDNAIQRIKKKIKALINC